MAFQIQNFSRASAGANEEISEVAIKAQIENGKVVKRDFTGCFRTYNYFSKYYDADLTTVTGDNQSAIAADGYFNPVAKQLQVNDLINAYSAKQDAYVTYQVVSVPTNESTKGNVVVKSFQNFEVYQSTVSLSDIENSTVTNSDYRYFTAGPFDKNELTHIKTNPLTILMATDEDKLIKINSIVLKSTTGVGFYGSGYLYFQYGTLNPVLITPQDSCGLGIICSNTSTESAISIPLIKNIDNTVISLVKGQSVYLTATVDINPLGNTDKKLSIAVSYSLIDMRF